MAFVASDQPVLRHDWFPIVPSLSFAVDNVTGWDPTGVGTVIAYPASFLMIFARSAGASVLGAYPTHLLYFALCGWSIVFGAARLARVLGARPAVELAAALFAAFNPWTYTELVAGHSWMLLSYGATYWVIAECCERERNERRLIPLVLAIAPQVQYLVVNFFFYVWLALRMRSWRSLLAICAMLLPIVVGVELSRTVLRGIPLTLEWERSQSVEPLRAVFLSGYFTHYDAALAPFFTWTCWFVAALAFAGVVRILTARARDAWLIPFAAVPLVWSFGTKGPCASIFAWTILHVSEAALFRELYDLLGFVAIGYVAFCTVATVRWRALAVPWLLAGAAMLAAWTLAPPARFWVPSRALPAVGVPTKPNTRFALMPALFPASFEGRGSGTDPDLYPRDENVTPVNQAFALYPVSAAIGSYLRDGRIDRLGALSVRSIVARPWLQTDPSIRYQFALPAPAWLFRTIAHSRDVPAATPLLSVSAYPAVASLASNLGGGNVLAGDARVASGPLVPAAWRTLPALRGFGANSTFVSATEGWVDARLAFVEAPELGQAYGGALTTNSAAVLPLDPERAALVWVRGTLSSSDGAPLVASTNGYRWIALPPAVDGVRCAGLCVVAAQTAEIPAFRLNPPMHASREVAFRALTPWLVLATVPAGGAELLRYNVTFDNDWLAYAHGFLSHVRIDGVVNGWLLPARGTSATAVLLEGGAACVAFSELVATLLISFVMWPQIARGLRAVERRVRGSQGRERNDG